MTGIELSFFSFIGMGIILGIIKLFFSNTITEKMVILDAITTAITGIIIFLSVKYKIEYLLDIAIIYAILSFSAIVIIARYIENRKMED